MDIKKDDSGNLPKSSNRSVRTTTSLFIKLSTKWGAVQEDLNSIRFFTFKIQVITYDIVDTHLASLSL